MQVLIDGVEYTPKIVPPPPVGTLGVFLRSARKASGRSLDGMSQVVGCSKSFLWELEKDMAVPGLLMAARIAESYGVSLDEMGRRVLAEVF